MLGLKALRVYEGASRLEYWRALYNHANGGYPLRNPYQPKLSLNPTQRGFASRVKHQLEKEIVRAQEAEKSNPEALLHRWPVSGTYMSTWVSLRLRAMNDTKPAVKEDIQHGTYGPGIYGAFNWQDASTYLYGSASLPFLAETRDAYALNTKGWRTLRARLVAIVVPIYRSTYHSLEDETGSEHMLITWMPFLTRDTLIAAAASKWKLPVISLDEAKQRIADSVRAEGFKVRTRVVQYDCGRVTERMIRIPEPRAARTTGSQGLSWKQTPALEEGEWISVST